MVNIMIPPGWRIPERDATPESVYISRRTILKLMGFGGMALAGAAAGCEFERDDRPLAEKLKTYTLSEADKRVYPAGRNPAFVLDRAMTDELVAAHYNNFYEFSDDKDDVWRKAALFQPRPWEVEVTGLVKRPFRMDVDQLILKMPMEERLCRHRCVEAWAMAVPWTGFPMKALIDYVEPRPSARFVAMTSFLRPVEAPGHRNEDLPWPYTEALTMAEALNPLTLLATGIYGHPLPKQHGAPLRLVTPWKYGYKSVKSIVRIDFTAGQPFTFWNTLLPDEYDFAANVNPTVPHPRWSQRTEKMIGTGERRDTVLYNGYGNEVAALYS